MLAPSRQREFDYPAGEGDAAAYSSYDGRGGVSVASFAAPAAVRDAVSDRSTSCSRATSPTRRAFCTTATSRERARAGAAVPGVRSRSVHGDRERRPAAVDARRLYGDRPLSVRASRSPDGTNYMRNSVKVVIDAYDGNVRGVPRGAGRPDDPDAGAHLSGTAAAARDDAGRPARASALSRGSVPRADGAVRDVSHGEPGDVLSSRGSVADSRRAAWPRADDRRRTGGSRASRSCGTW